MEEYSFQELVQAYFDCRKHKRNSQNALAFEENLETNLLILHNEIISGTYFPGRSLYFVLSNPKYREVWAADFRDRVVHHLIYNRISQPYFERFIYDSYSCIPNKGTLAATNRLKKKIITVTQNYTIPGYALKIDVKNFFGSINKNILQDILEKDKIITETSNCFSIDNKLFLNIFERVLLQDVSRNYRYKGAPNLKSRVPAHKRLRTARPNCGLPIGNLPSQLLANVYMNPLDQFAKHDLKIQHYIRYVDDIIVLGNSPIELQKTATGIETFLRDNLELEIHSSKIIISNLKPGIKFLGRNCFYYHSQPNQRVIKSFRHKISLGTKIKPILKQQRTNLKAVSNSYLGLIKHDSTFQQRKNLFRTSLNKFGAQTNYTYGKVV